MSPIEIAVKAAGSQAALARELGVSAPFVSQMVSGVKNVPPGLCRAIEALTGGTVTAEQLRPDVFERVPTESAA